MTITLDRFDQSPLHRQIAEQIRTAIREGRIPLGAALPTVRALAETLGVAHLTAYRAYDELRTLGFIKTQPRQSTRVVDSVPAHQAVLMLGQLPEAGPVSGYESLGRSAGLRSMASAVADPELFQSDELISEIEAIKRDSPWSFYYCEPTGSAELLEQIRLLLANDGAPCPASELLVTYGGTHALSLLLDSICCAGDTVLVQEPGPLGLRELLATKQIVGVAVRLAGSGIDLDHAKHCLDWCQPRAMIVSPDFGHSTGLLMSNGEREATVEFARSTGIRLIEDSSLAALNLDGLDRIPMSALDSQVVATVGSFSYTLSPGIRTGYLRATSAIHSKAMARFKAEGISGIGFLHVALARYMARGAYDAHLRRVIPKYRARRDTLLGVLRTWMPEQVTWTRSVGGLSTWVALGPGHRPTDLYKNALRRGVSFSPGSLFYVDVEPERHLRLSYGLLDPQSIREAARALAEIIG